MQPPMSLSLGQRLLRERKRLAWSQQRLAAEIGATSMSINRWEHDRAMPQTYYREQLCRVFKLSAESLFAPSLEEKDDASTSPSVWHVPFRRNPFFTGREDILQSLYDALHSNRAVALTQALAINGLGGIGKTQTAIEYAYRNHEDYQAVLWVQADTQELLFRDLVALAAVLHIAEPEQKHDQNHLLLTVQRWLCEHERWLLVLDNVEDIGMISTFLPSMSSGHLLLTTRTQVTGTLAHGISLETMPQQEGALFLLRRAKRIDLLASLEDASATERFSAMEIAHVMDGLPLALDQAGAYLEETACRLPDYLDAYWRQRASLLNLRGSGSTDHPSSVSTTFVLALEQVEQANTAAAALLRFCAFLHPDAIPEELIIEGAAEIDPLLEKVAHDTLAFNAAIKELRRFSLLRRDPNTNTFSLHRLVQAVLKDGMDEQMQRQWAERTVRAVNLAFPGLRKLMTLPHGQRYLSHVLACALLIEQWDILSKEAEELLTRTGLYLMECGQYDQAAPLFRQALTLREQILGPEHINVAESLHHLGHLSYYQGKYREAEELYHRALTLREKTLGPEHPQVAETLNQLGELSYYQGEYAQAELLYHRALTIREQVLGPEHIDVAESLHNLAFAYYTQGKYAQAEPLYQRTHLLSVHLLGSEHPLVAHSLNNLGNLYRTQGKYVQAESLYQQALAIRKGTLGSEHPRLAESFGNLGLLCYKQGKYVEAEALLVQARAIYQKVLGVEHPNMAALLGDLAELDRVQGKYAQAKALFAQALTLHEKLTGLKHPRIAQCLNNLADLYITLANYDEAQSLCRQALAIRQDILGSEHPALASSLNTLARLAHDQGKYTQAESLYQQARAIQEKTLGPEHPDLVQLLTNEADLFVVQGKYTLAESLYLRALRIGKQCFGSEHPDVARSLAGWGVLLGMQGQYAKAESCYQQAQAIQEKVFGPEHPDLAGTLSHLAHLYKTQHHYRQAESLYRRALSIWQDRLGEDHPKVRKCLEELCGLAQSIETEGYSEQ